MDSEVGSYLLDRHARTAVPRDPHDILAELFRIRLWHSDILPTRPTGQASSDVTRSCGRPARFAADSDIELRTRLGLTRTTPDTTTLGRLLVRLDGDALDDAISTWLAHYARDPADEPGDTLVGLAIDGKAVHGSRTSNNKAVYLLAAALHTTGTVIAQRQIPAKRNEIPAFAPLLDRIYLHGTVVTADALHSQRAHAEHVIAAAWPLPSGRQGQPEEAPQATQEAALGPDPAAGPRRGLRRRPLARAHRHRAARHSHHAQHGHRPRAPGRLDQHRRRDRPLPITPRARHRPARSRYLRTHSPWVGVRPPEVFLLRW